MLWTDSPRPTARMALDGERRHLTVLFCDLVGSTAIAARLDPEEWRETLAGFHRAAAEAITRFDGHVAKYLGDGVMAYFGWPAAHDNDAERAARAGLAILDAIAKLNQQPGHAKLAVRIGIDSGLVVIGKGAGQDAEVFGETANIAARVEAAAEPGTVAISDAAHRLVSGLFVVEDLGAADAQRHRTAASALSRGAAERSARTLPGGDRGRRIDALRRARRRTALADESLGARTGWRGPGRVDHRRSGHRQVAPVAALPRADRGHAAYLGRGGRRGVFPEHALLSGQRDAAAFVGEGRHEIRSRQLERRLTAAGLSRPKRFR